MFITWDTGRLITLDGFGLGTFLFASTLIVSELMAMGCPIRCVLMGTCTK